MPAPCPLTLPSPRHSPRPPGEHRCFGAHLAARPSSPAPPKQPKPNRLPPAACRGGPTCGPTTPGSGPPPGAARPSPGADPGGAPPQGGWRQIPGVPAPFPREAATPRAGRSTWPSAARSSRALRAARPSPILRPGSASRPPSPHIGKITFDTPCPFPTLILPIYPAFPPHLPTPAPLYGKEKSPHRRPHLRKRDR